VARLWSPLSLPQLTARHPGHRGAATVGAILGALRVGEQITKEEMAARLMRLIRGASLPRPELNVWIRIGRRSFECDAVWRSERVMVELDGYAVHGTRHNFESDRERDRILHAHEWRVIRVTWRQLCDDPDGIVRDLRLLLT
jgi:very-short-patch-repair endonuclease